MMKLIISTLLVVSSLTAFGSDQVGDELRYNEFMDALRFGQTKSEVTLSAHDTKLMIDALWDAQENNLVPMNLRAALREFPQANLSITDRLRLGVLRHRVDMTFGRRSLGTALLMGLADATEGETLALLVLSLRKDLHSMGLSHVVKSAQLMQPAATTLNLTTEVAMIGDQSHLATDLWLHHPDLEQWSDGKYSKGIRLYMFCRTKREYPCLQILRNARHEAVRLDDGTLWSSPALAKSARNLPSNQRNGNTPTGIHTINGVMPYPDQIPSFGKFRRLILDFVPKSSNEQRQRAILPDSSLDSPWWKPNVVARDIGRSLFRIHGTGRVVEEETAPWFPFRPTSGCIAKRENKYGELEFRDQQNLLDTLMTAMDLPVQYQNETEIKGLLFVMEIDDKEGAVTMEDLKAIGIE